MNSNEWRIFLESWEAKLRTEFTRHRDIWDQLGLPDLAEFEFFVPVHDKPALPRSAAARKGAEELLTFYSVTDGWPLLIGEDLVEISPIKEIDAFREIGGENFDIAAANAPMDLDIDQEKNLLSASEISSAILISRPVIARELLLWLESGEVCLYLFEDVMRFDSLIGFLNFHLEWTLRDVRTSI
ncbi:hypothetical protein IC757_03125 [Wenzhouxiangella sp. AB-CW3]|uniref:hypothetical protein n=1 Tax=Wenzhouxiangella sp. AB-CW3 TaxID=2771012 RepID=UPI00168BACD4|nr:hypothetical protein [Wenzhouxiangella sp. AB-CW3]QOC23167.1 hypothetical protein IC757_03125 [Wenzhouxiangella sp. AB-CW3]